MQHGQPLQHFFHNVVRMINELFHDEANVQGRVADPFYAHKPEAGQHFRKADTAFLYRRLQLCLLTLKRSVLSFCL